MPVLLLFCTSFSGNTSFFITGAAIVYEWDVRARDSCVLELEYQQLMMVRRNLSCHIGERTRRDARDLSDSWLRGYKTRFTTSTALNCSSLSCPSSMRRGTSPARALTETPRRLIYYRQAHTVWQVFSGYVGICTA